MLRRGGSGESMREVKGNPLEAVERELISSPIQKG
jgi:hypothetical protein